MRIVLPPLAFLTVLSPIALLISPPPLNFAIVLRKTLWFHYYPLGGRCVCALSFRPSISLLSSRYALCFFSRRPSVPLLSSRTPLSSLFFLRRPFRLHFIFSPIAAFIVPPSLCLLSCCRSISLLFPRCPFLFITIPPQAFPFAHCPSVSPRKPFASAPPKTARCAYFPPEGRLFSYSPSQGCSVYLLSPNPLGFPNVSPKGARFV